ncbi:MAG TPA: hypothetical protein VJU82_08965, partial [Acidobacteriaceae bacterium]|nr:hypothetical protein [Acidobacteriaceae bacterium]
MRRAWPAALSILAAIHVASAQVPASLKTSQRAMCGVAHRLLLAFSPNGMLAAPPDSGCPRVTSWFFVPHVKELETAAGPAHDEYLSAQRLARATSAADVVGIPSFLGVVIFTSSDPQERPWILKVENRLLGLTVATELLTVPVGAREAEHLSRAAWLYGRPAVPQTPDSAGCTYYRCALRLHFGAWSTRLGQGLESRPVPSRELLAHASDSARSHFERYLELHRRTRLTKPIVLAGVAGFAALSSSDQTVRGVGLGMLGVGLVTGQLSIWTL